MDDRPGRRGLATAAYEHAELRDYLRRVRTQLWWREASVLLVTSIGLGAVLTATMVLVRVRADAGSNVEPVEVAALAVVAGIGTAIFRRPSGARAARVADRHAQLENRLATALEILEGRMHGELASLQLGETWLACRSLAARHAVPVFTRTLRTAMVVMLVMTSLALLVSVRANDLWSILDRWAPASGMSIVDAPVPLTDEIPSLPQAGADVATTSARLPEQLQSQDVQSRNVQAAVAKLADGLKGTAAAADTGASLQRQDYDAATGQLRDLARESDQLSATAKQELARALLQVSTDSAALDQPLAAAEADAARALGRGDYQAGRSALENLAQVLTERRRTANSPPQRANALQQTQNQDVAARATGGPCGGGDEYSAGPVDCSPAALYSTGAMRTVGQTSDMPSPVASTGELGRGGGYAGGGSNTSSLGDVVTRIDATGDNVVQVDLTPGGAQGRGGQPDPKAETTMISQVDQKDVVQSGLPQASQPITDVSESTAVPPALGRTVRGFFQASTSQR